MVNFAHSLKIFLTWPSKFHFQKELIAAVINYFLYLCIFQTSLNIIWGLYLASVFILEFEIFLILIFKLEKLFLHEDLIFFFTQINS